jgi:hypothetical protein
MPHSAMNHVPTSTGQGKHKMAYSEIYIRDGITGKEVEAELPDNVAIKDLLPAITAELGLENLINRKLINKTKVYEYNDEDTLASRGTNNRDLCLLTYEPVIGEPPQLENAKKEGPEPLQKDTEEPQKAEAHKIPGIDIKDIPDLGYDDLLKNKGSIPLILKRYVELEVLCNEQRKETNFLRTQKETTKTSTALFLLAQIVIAFGVNLTTQKVQGGVLVLIAGISILSDGLFFVLRGSKRQNPSEDRQDNHN